MRNIARCAFLLALVSTGVGSAQLRDLVGASFDGKVVAIIDGDTVDVVPAGEKRAVRIRLEGIDAPESGEPFSNAATRSTRVLLFDQHASIEGRDVDQYGRLVARVSVHGQDASIELVKAGLACHYTRYSSDALLARAEADAHREGRGFWATGAPKPRCTTTPALASPRPNANPKVTVFHGNTSSRVYHAPSCRNYNCRNCTRTFRSENEAHVAGFRPAGDCLRR